MKIFLIYGEAHVGKTTTCRKILTWLNAHGWNQLTHEPIEHPDDSWIGDFKVKGTLNGKTIAIYSPGDDCGHLREAISFAHQSPYCDILIATVRKGIHYHQIINPLEMSPLYSVNWLSLQGCESISDKDSMENKIADQIIQQIL